MREQLVREAYARHGGGDLAGFLELFARDAKFFVPGTTRISGDHPREKLRDVLTIADEIAAGTLRRDLLDFLVSEHSVAVVLHDHLTRDGKTVDYHAIHVWDIADGRFTYWWIYPHEYDRFERAWA